MKQSNNKGLIFSSHLFGAAVTKEDYSEAWNLANSFWTGSPRKQRIVLFAMISKILENQQIILTRLGENNKGGN